MANEKQLIRSLVNPRIVLDDIQATDVEQGTGSSQNSTGSPVSYSKQYGAVFPLIQILETVFSPEQILYLKIDSAGDVPYVDIQLNINDKSFYSTSFPKDGDLVSVFIRSKDDTFKPIRNDFEITSISVYAREGGGENSSDTMSVSGILRIPGYDAMKCFSKKGTSLDVLMKVAEDLNIGFATNEVDTADEQTWICPFEKTRSFIKSTTMSAWKDDSSFFTSFIDPFYFLNFVNVEPLFSEKSEIDEAMCIDLLTNDYGKDSVQGKAVSRTVLTNWDEASSTPFHILSYGLVNNSASINLTHGYKRYVQYYDALLKEEQTFFVDPKTTPDAEKDKIILKGRPNENFYLSQVEGKWMGAQYGKSGENCHAFYNYAKVNNFQNIVHLDKMGLKVTLNNINVNLRRMQPVPVVITIKRDTVRKRLNEPVDEDGQKSPKNENEPNREKSALDFEETPIVVDKTISGFYVVSEISYVYTGGKFTQECFLLRREWPTPPQLY